MDTCVFCEVQGELVTNIHMNFRLQMIKLFYQTARAQIFDFVTGQVSVFCVVLLNCM
jgi:hypothetical protein